MDRWHTPLTPKKTPLTPKKTSKTVWSKRLDQQIHLLHPHRMNQNMRKVKYAVRGAIVIRAGEIDKELKKGSSAYPFSEVIYCNIGNPHRVGQKPLTFPSQVLALLNYPALMEQPNLFPSDVIDRARALKDHTPGGLGAYTHSQGLPYVRESVARFIEARDGYPSNPDHIFLTDGASPAVKYIIKMLRQHPSDAFLVPNPQYPLYSATLQDVEAIGIPYTLREDAEWSVDMNNLEHMLQEAKGTGLTVKAMVVINPGNPTGQCLSIDTMRTIIDFCINENLVLLADEVYQENVYHPEKPFHSFKKLWMQMQEERREDGNKDSLELFSFHSVSKGLYGECGRRGGYVETVNTHPGVLKELYKAASVSLCPNTIGQMMVNLMVDPPKPGSPSYELYSQETSTIYKSLKIRAKILGDFLNSLDGVSCNAPEGAMYAFPRITLGPTVVAAAEKLNQTPDSFYAFRLLEETGLVVVPGSGFILAELSDAHDAFFFRTTFLPPEDKMREVFKSFREFHVRFMSKYSGTAI